MTTEVKFFIPKAKDDTQAEEVWVSIKKFAEKTLDWDISDRRIFSIAYQKHGEDYYVEVGKPDPRNGELVIAILKSNTYLVCTSKSWCITWYADIGRWFRIDSGHGFSTKLEICIF